jgi:hypothetical protein
MHAAVLAGRDHQADRDGERCDQRREADTAGTARAAAAAWTCPRRLSSSVLLD